MSLLIEDSLSILEESVWPERKGEGWNIECRLRVMKEHGIDSDMIKGLLEGLDRPDV